MTNISRRAMGTAFAGLAAFGLSRPSRAAGVAKRIYIMAVVPDGTGDVYMTGDNDAFGPWNPGLVKMYVDGNKRVLPYDAHVGDTLEYKFTLGSWDNEAVDANGNPYSNFRLIVGDQQVYRHVIPAFKR